MNIKKLKSPLAPFISFATKMYVAPFPLPLQSISLLAGTPVPINNKSGYY